MTKNTRGKIKAIPEYQGSHPDPQQQKPERRWPCSQGSCIQSTSPEIARVSHLCPTPKLDPDQFPKPIPNFKLLILRLNHSPQAQQRPSEG